MACRAGRATRCDSRQHHTHRLADEAPCKAILRLTAGAAAAVRVQHDPEHPAAGLVVPGTPAWLSVIESCRLRSAPRSRLPCRHDQQRAAGQLTPSAPAARFACFVAPQEGSGKPARSPAHAHTRALVGCLHVDACYRTRQGRRALRACLPPWRVACSQRPKRPAPVRVCSWHPFQFVRLYRHAAALRGNTMPETPVCSLMRFVGDEAYRHT